jgi:hypothetical protein
MEQRYKIFEGNRILFRVEPGSPGYAVAQLVEALRYKPEGRGFDSRCSHWNFSVTWSFRSHCSPEVDLASNKNEYQKSFLGLKTAGA